MIFNFKNAILMFTILIAINFSILYILEFDNPLFISIGSGVGVLLALLVFTKVFRKK